MTYESIDLPAYLQRISASAPSTPDLASLRSLMVAHLAQIPFENIDVLLGVPIRLDLGSLQAKLVESRRGGYCFEHNTLFATALAAMGFAVQTLEARVRPNARSSQQPTPRTHMTLRVDLGDESFLVDVGFGADGPLWPVPLDGSIVTQPDGRVRVVAADEGLLLQRANDTDWSDLYSFTLARALPIDYEVANFYTSCFPGSHFLRTLTVQRSTEGQRYVLRGRSYSIRSAEGTTTTELAPGEIPTLLRGTFGLVISDDEVARALGSAIGS